ncbi:MAG TPA: hypothetical protein VGL99_20860 [Chloroflexota bacterium]
MGPLRHRGARAALIGTLLALASGVTPALATGSTPYVAFFPKELTTPRACPAGTPPGAFCYTGQDHSNLGKSVPPGGRATEDFSGFVDLNSPQPGACPDGSTGFPDHNDVTITTVHGKLFLTTDGLACGLGAPTTTDDGTWHAFGGTGIFSGASGSGKVHTDGTPNADGTISSSSTYKGTLNLN